MPVVHVQDGETLDYTPVADLAPGEVVVQGDLVGVTRLPIKAGERGSISVVGVFEFPKETGANKDISSGAKVYWDAANKLAKKTSGGGVTYLGKAVRAATDVEATVRVRLEQ